MHDDLKLETRDKVLQKMSRNGAVEQNVSRGTDRNISSRIAEITFEKNPAPGSDIEFGRGAKEAARAGGSGGLHRSYNGTVGQGTDYGGGGQGGISGSPYERISGNTQGDPYSGDSLGGFRGGSQGGMPYSDHEAYLDSLLQKAGVDTGHGADGFTDSGSSHHSRNRRYRAEAGRPFEVQRMQEYQMSEDSFDISGHRKAFAEGQDALNISDESGNAGQTAGEQAGSYLSEGGNGVLQKSRSSAFRIDGGSNAGRSLAEKEAYKRRISRASVRQSAMHEKSAEQRLYSERGKTATAGDISGGIQSGGRSGAKKTFVSIREGQKAGTVLKPFSGTADKLRETALSSAHEKIHESEDENSGVQAAHEAEIQAEHVLQTAGRKAADAGKGVATKRRGRLKFDDEEPAEELNTGRKASEQAQGGNRLYLGNEADTEFQKSGGSERKSGATDDRKSVDNGKPVSDSQSVKASKDAAQVSKDAQTQGAETFAGQSEKSSRLSFSSSRADNVSQMPMEAGKSGNSALAAKKQSGGKLYFGEKPNADAGKKAADLNKQFQKKHIKREYAAALKAEKSGASTVTKASSKAAEAVKKGAGKLKDVLADVIKKNYGALIALGVMGIFFIMILSASGTVMSMFSEAGESFVGSTYLAADDDITNNDTAYEEMEAELQDQIDSIEEDYSGYDEYRYQVDEISHDPYALASYFTAIYWNYKAADVEAELLPLFQEQYTLALNEVVETRTRTVTDPDTGEESEEEYDWYVLEVTLTNAGIDTVAQAHMNENQKMLYGAYMVSKGNRPYLFGDGAVPGNVAGGGLSYDIPPEALEDEAFARMINEAEKYLGMEYVWGGSSPSSGFDCSGFVSWVINHSGNGWNVGRSTANGLMGHCTHVSSSEAKPGDLVFFERTYNTSGASHVGIYVGDGMMIHCGNPIQYTSINSNYWQNHFLGFGRISD